MNNGYIAVSEDRLNAISTELMKSYHVLEVMRDVERGLSEEEVIEVLQILHEALLRIYVMIFVQDRYLDSDLRSYERDSKFQQFMEGVLGGSTTII